MPRALITGITGMAGSHLADFLIDHTDWDVCGFCRWRSPLDNLARHIDRINRGDRFFLYRGDLRDCLSVQQAVVDANPDYVFHLASQSFGRESPLNTLETNVQGTAHLLEALRMMRTSGMRIHVCSTSEVYGNVSLDETPIKETARFHPTSLYAISKIGADLIGRYYAEAYDMHVIVTRAFTHTGPRRGENFAESSFAKQIAMIEAGFVEPLIVVGNLQSVRTIADVRDVVRAYYLILTADLKPGSCYNFGGDWKGTIGQVLDYLIAQSTKTNLKWATHWRRMRPLDNHYQEPDSTAFKSATGWKPTISFQQTMTDLLDYWRERVKREGDRFLVT